MYCVFYIVLRSDLALVKVLEAGRFANQGQLIVIPLLEVCLERNQVFCFQVPDLSLKGGTG